MKSIQKNILDFNVNSSLFDNTHMIYLVASEKSHDLTVPGT